LDRNQACFWCRLSPVCGFELPILPLSSPYTWLPSRKSKTWACCLVVFFAQCSPNVHQGPGGSSAKGLFITNYAVATRRQIPAFRANGFIFGAEPLVAQVYFLGFPLSIFGSCPIHGCCLLARFLSNLTLPCPFFDPSTALRKDCSQPRVQVSYNQGRMDVFCKFKTFKALLRNLSCDTKSVSIIIVEFQI